MWNSPSSYRDESGNTIKADGWRSSNGAAADFNGQLNPTANEVTVRALIAGQVTISVNAIFVFSHAVEANGFKQQTDLLGNLSAKTAISNVTPNVSVRYGSAISPVTVQDNGTVNLGVGEILQFNYSISRCILIMPLSLRPTGIPKRRKWLRWIPTVPAGSLQSTTEPAPSPCPSAG